MLFLVFALVIVGTTFLLIKNNRSKKEIIQTPVAVEVKPTVVEVVATEEQLADLAVAKEEVKKQKAVVKKAKPAEQPVAKPVASTKNKKVVKK